MIVKMRKTYVAARRDDRDRLLDVLRSLGVIHLAPVDPARAIAEEKTVADVDQLGRAMQILSAVEPAGEQPDISAVEAAAEVLDIQRRLAEAQSRLNALHRQMRHLDLWGDVRLEQFAKLREAGIDVRFYTIERKLLNEIEAECVQVVGPASGKKVLIAVIDRTGDAKVPDEADPVPLPKQDRSSLIAEAGEIDASLKANSRRLGELAHLADAMRAEHAKLREHAEYTRAQHSGLAEGGIYALQGWVPADKAESLAPGLRAADMDAAVETFEPAEDENPPTLIQYPRWARPIKGLFDILGTNPGYREFDVGVPFMIALPIFAAMLIGDGGYGAVLLLGPLLFYKKAAKALGAEFTRLLMVIGAATLIWGLLSASFFGVLLYKPLIPVNMSDSSRSLIMRISFFMGATHLSIAQLWRGVAFWPSWKSLCPVGWAIFIWGMLGVVMYFVLGGADPRDTNTPWPYLLISGAALAILFDSPSKSPVKMIGMGLANFPLSMLSAFSDVISYVRLMAVGLASGVLASSFNELAFSAGSWIVAIPVLVFGHGLNLGLALIALFAHGVRLNMLEFSNNLGMQWTGTLYKPFTKTCPEEIAT